MRVAVTRPQADGERTARALRARGHDVLLAPLLRIESLPADVSGDWSAVAVTSANALSASGDRIARLKRLPIFTVGRRTAAAATEFAEVHSADGDVHDLVRLIVAEHRGGKLLYLAGEDRAADLVGALAQHGIAGEMRIVYRAVAVPYPEPLVAALSENTLDAVLHFSRRTAEIFLAGARAAQIERAALTAVHFCLSAHVAEPLRSAGAARLEVAPHPDEGSLLGLLERPGP